MMRAKLTTKGGGAVDGHLAGSLMRFDSIIEIG